MSIDLPPGYFEAVHKMDAAAAAWMKGHPFAQPRFNLRTFELDMKRRAGRPEHENVLIAATLREVVDKIALNEDGRQLLYAMDAAVDGQATYNMAKVLIDLNFEAQVARSQGQLPAGDWHCPCCAKLIDGFSDLSLRGHKPGPGTLTVCAYCFSCLRITDGRFEGLTAADVAQLPPGARVALQKSAETARKVAADRAKRS
jgi:hypothetical protein